MPIWTLLLACNLRDQGISARDTGEPPPVKDYGDPASLTGPSEAVFSDNDGLYILDLEDGSTHREGSQTAFHLSLSPNHELAVWGDRRAVITPLTRQDEHIIDEVEHIDHPIGFIDGDALLFRDENLMSSDGINLIWIRGDKAGTGTYFLPDLPDGVRLVVSDRALSSGRSKLTFASGDDREWSIHVVSTWPFPNFGYDHDELPAYKVDDALIGCEPQWRPGGLLCATEEAMVLLDSSLGSPVVIAPPGGIKDADVLGVDGAVLFKDNKTRFWMRADAASGALERFKAWDPFTGVRASMAVVSEDGRTILFASEQALYRGTSDGSALFEVRRNTSSVRSITW